MQVRYMERVTLKELNFESRNAALLELKKQGYEDVFLWCLEKNIRARHFYEQIGFTLTDDFFDDNIGGENLREVRYIYKRQ